MIVHHVGIVCNKEVAQKLWDLLGLIADVKHDHKYVPEFDCDCIMLSGVELVIPKGGKLLEWLDEQGTSIHHVAIKVGDVAVVGNRLKDLGIKLVTEEPVAGVSNTLVNFIHPSEYGVMIELVQEV